MAWVKSHPVGDGVRLGIDLEFMSWPQQTERGREMREWIVREVQPLDRDRMLEALHAPATAE